MPHDLDRPSHGSLRRLRGLPPGTSAEIAAAAALDERYVREWLGAMVTARVMNVDPNTRRYSLPAEHAASLTRAAAADNLAVFAQYISGLGGVEEHVLQCFRDGGGVPYEKFPRFHDVMEEDSGQSVLSSLESHILPLGKTTGTSCASEQPGGAARLGAAAAWCHTVPMPMRNVRYPALVALVLLWTASAAAQDAPASAGDPRHAQSRELATALQQALGSRLMTALRSGGPVAAIEVCHVEAPAIAAGLSASAAAQVGRTTLKVRNPDNAPDQAARAVLERFERQWEGPGAAAAAAPPEDYTVAADGSARYMRGIVTQELCLVCHGSDVAPEVAAAIRARYPDDAATGYALGTLRGAFLIEWPRR